MTHNLRQELLITILIIVLLFFVVDPFGFMPSTVVMMLLVGLVLLFGIFVGFLWREKAVDEREVLHRMYAGRAAFLVGSAVLVVGIIVQTVQHSLDMWPPLALGGMMIAKVLASAYGRSTK